MWNQPYLETCCRAALHRLVLAADHGRPPALKDGPCLDRLATMGFARSRADGWYAVTAAGASRHASEILHETPDATAATPHHARLAGLDALRGLAALCVVLFHVLIRYPRARAGLPIDGTPVFPGFSVSDAGVVPVLCFFIISGFVITWTLDRTRSPMDFAVSRFSRLYPAYWAAIALTLVVQWFDPIGGALAPPGTALVNLTMLQEFVGVPNVAGVFWSLSYELVFYALAFGLFILGLWRHVRWAAFAWVLLAIITIPGGVPVPWRVRQLLALNYAPYFAAGMMLYALWRGEARPLALAVLGLAAAAVLLTLNPLPAAAVSVFAGLILLSAQGRAGWLAAAPLAWLGSISYALYLSHEQFSFAVIHRLGNAGVPAWAATIAAVVLALLLAWAITRAVEQPALHAIRAAWRRVRPAPDSAAVAAGPPARPAAPGSPG